MEAIKRLTTYCLFVSDVNNFTFYITTVLNSFEFTLTALRIGDTVLAGLPGECFSEIGRRIEGEYNVGNIVVCCLTNGGDSYFPTSRAYDEGGYEARTSRLAKGGDDVIVNKKKQKVAPGEMETVKLTSDMLSAVKSGKLTFSIE